MSTSTDDDEEISTIVMDLGSHMTKAGFAGDDAPRSLIRTAVGLPLKSDANNRVGSNANTADGRSCTFRNYISDSDHCYWRRPMERGIVTDWDLMEELWRFIFNKELYINTKEQPLLVTEHALNPKGNREKMAELAFETFHFPGLAVMPSSMLNIYANGRVSGLAVDSGEGVTHTLAIYEGFAFNNAINRVDMGGYDVTMQLQQLLFEKKGLTFTTESELSLVRTIKENMAYVAFDYDAESSTFSSSQVKRGGCYSLPDGTNLQLDQERFQCYEPLFKPELFGHDGASILSLPSIVRKTIQECSIHSRADLWCNVLLSGSNTMAPGFSERMTKELSNAMPSSLRLKVIAPPERRCSVWIGGSILGSLSHFRNVVVTKAMYEEHGPQVMHRL